MGLFVGTLVVFLIIFLIFQIFALAFRVVGKWLILKKAGRPGWVSLIPFYGNYHMFSMACGMGWIGIVYSFLKVAYTIAMGLGTDIENSNIDFSSSPIPTTIYFVCYLCTLGLDLYLHIMTTKRFNLHWLYVVGLFFLPSIFRIIIGAGKDFYYTPVGDNISWMGNNPQNNWGQQSQYEYNQQQYNQTAGEWVDETHFHDRNTREGQYVADPYFFGKKQHFYCAYCGTEIEEGMQTCPACNAKVQ